ncbi:succinate dehydrogenase assembly factor 2-B, mitochondrial [Aethina tumida]|uniref:succinate dehydrogenase assembly factor 2-B, mitochondrial n=1 Tax=Aethina tumida TaxID=116153 RepID=UPI0021486484|nr:succinate dehydrogenase assembly factor 2-B, mitochondrial [Aethina tumida]
MNSIVLKNCTLLRNSPTLIRISSALNQRGYNSSGNVVDPPDDFIPIPRCQERENEPLTQKKNRLQYQSRKRGMLENDLLLSTFAAKYLKDFTSEETAEYDRLINGPSNDWDLYYWATGIKPIPEEFDSKIMQLLVEHCKNLNKESRIRQPDLVAM